MEMRNLPSAQGKDSAFHTDLFQRYDEGEVKLWDRPHIENLVIIDPAKTANFKSAESAIVGVGLDMRNHRIYLRDAISEKLHQDEFYDAVLEMITSINAQLVAVEDADVVQQFNSLTYINAKQGKNKGREKN